jgi:ABC-type antimicrobial peptide transport system permease subunit
MKTIQTSLNEKQYKEFKQKATLEGISEYALLKRFVLKELLHV